VASPEDLMIATKGVSQAVAKAVMAANSGDQDKVAAVANLGRKVVSDVLTVCKAAAYGCEDEATREAELKEGEDLAKEFQDLLRQVLEVSKSPSAEKKGELMSTSKGIAETVTKMAKLAEKLKGKDWIDKQGQMEMIAEKEMKKAADSIERAAQRLAELKLKRHVLDEGAEVSLEDMTFDDLILESAQSITKATSSLMKAATAAQKELVSQGKMKDKKGDEGDDGQWAQGLISAAALVASATQALCEAANTTIQEGSDGTHLVASAKQVSKATAQLVLACQVKAESGSKSMEGLKVASNAVRKATDELVKAAQGTHEKTPFIKVKKDIFKERIDAEAKVLKLEQELSEAKALQLKLSAKTSFLVSDIRKAREAEGRAMTLAKELQAAREHVLELNKKQYEGNEPEAPQSCLRSEPDIARVVELEERGMRQSLRMLQAAGRVRTASNAFK